MTSKPKANSVIATVADSVAHTLTFSVTGVGDLVLKLDDVSAETKARAMLHGFTQRVADAAALSRDETTGLPATPADKFAAMKALVDHYNSGASEWRLAGASGGREGSGLLFTCLMEIYPDAGAEKIRAKIKGWKPAERASVLESEKVKVIADRIRAKAISGIDAEDLLATI